jgi:hypothetical protein
MVVWTLVKGKKDTNPERQPVAATNTIKFEAPTSYDISKEKSDYKSTLESYSEKDEETNLEQEVKKRPEIDFTVTSKTIKAKKEAEPVVQAQTIIKSSTVGEGSAQKKVNRLSQIENSVAPSLQPEQKSEDANGTTRRKLNSSTQQTKAKDTTFATTLVKSIEDPAQLEIPVVAHGDQTLMNEQRVKLRVTKETIVGGHVLEANQILTGTVAFKKDRVLITVYSFKWKNQTIRTRLFAYDKGELGIYAAGSTDKDIATNTGQQVASRTHVSVPTPLGAISVGGGAATKKITEKKNQFELTSQYNLILSDTEQQ